MMYIIDLEDCGGFFFFLNILQKEEEAGKYAEKIQVFSFFSFLLFSLLSFLPFFEIAEDKRTCKEMIALQCDSCNDKYIQDTERGMMNWTCIREGFEKKCYLGRVFNDK